MQLLQNLVANYKNTLPVRLGSRAYPYPDIVRDFQSVIGRETRSQLAERAYRLPDYLIACVRRQ